MWWLRSPISYCSEKPVVESWGFSEYTQRLVPGDAHISVPIRPGWKQIHKWIFLHKKNTYTLSGMISLRRFSLVKVQGLRYWTLRNKIVIIDVNRCCKVMYRYYESRLFTGRRKLLHILNYIFPSYVFTWLYVSCNNYTDVE